MPLTWYSGFKMLKNAQTKCTEYTNKIGLVLIVELVALLDYPCVFVLFWDRLWMQKQMYHVWTMKLSQFCYKNNSGGSGTGCFLSERPPRLEMFLFSHFLPACWNSMRIFFFLFFFSFIELLYSRISPRRFYRIVPFNEALEKLILPSAASLVLIQLIKLHGIFNLALWASILT